MKPQAYYFIDEKNANEIKPGDTILHNGELKTVCRNNIVNNKFTGICIHGKHYRLEPVKRVHFCMRDGSAIRVSEPAAKPGQTVFAWMA